jgi:hypothetical protein
MLLINAVALFILTLQFSDVPAGEIRNKVFVISVGAPLLSSLVGLVTLTPVAVQVSALLGIAVFLVQVSLIWLGLVYWVASSRSAATKVVGSYIVFQGLVTIVAGLMQG